MKYFIAIIVLLTMLIGMFLQTVGQGANNKNYVFKEYGVYILDNQKKKTSKAAIRSDRHFFRNYAKPMHVVRYVNPQTNETRVTFDTKDASNMVQYGKKGQWLYSIRNYAVNKLDKEIKYWVSSSYPEYEIVNMVQEIDVMNKTSIFLTIRQRKQWRNDDGFDWKQLRILNKEMMVVSEFHTTLPATVVSKN